MLRRKLLLLLLLLCFRDILHAQRITLEKILDRTSGTPYVGCRYTPAGLLLVNSLVSAPQPASWASHFQLFSRQLDSLGTGPLVSNSTWRAQAIVLAPTGGYTVATTAISPNWPTNGRDLAFYRYATPLALPRLTRIQDLDGGGDDLSTDLLAAPNGYFISAKVEGPSIPSRKFFKLLKTDTTGVILWQRNYGLSDGDFISGMRYTADGNILLAGQSAPAPTYDYRLRMLLVNQNGDSLNTLLYAYPNSGLRANGAFEDRLLALRGGGFAMLAELDTIGATYSMVLKVNRRLQPQWQYTYRAQPLFGFTRRMFFAGACELQDSSLLVLTTNQRGSPYNNPYYLLRLSGATGQLLSTYQFISTICSQFQATKLLPDGDSAVYVLGTCLGKAYAAHISLRGLPTVVTAAGDPVMPAPARVLLDALYPNPADEFATLSYRCPAGLTGLGTLRIRDVLGREAYQVTVAGSAAGTVRLPTAALAQGLYVCELNWPSQSPATRRLLVRH